MSDLSTVIEILGLSSRPVIFSIHKIPQVFFFEIQMIYKLTGIIVKFCEFVFVNCLSTPSAKLPFFVHTPSVKLPIFVHTLAKIIFNTILVTYLHLPVRPIFSIFLRLSLIKLLSPLISNFSRLIQFSLD